MGLLQKKFILESIESFESTVVIHVNGVEVNEPAKIENGI